MSQYSRLHDSLVASQQYKQAYSMAGDFAQRAQQTWVVAAAKQRLMPLAQPAVDSGGWAPAIDLPACLRCGSLLPLYPCQLGPLPAPWLPCSPQYGLPPCLLPAIPPPCLPAVMASPYYSSLVAHLQPIHAA